MGLAAQEEFIAATGRRSAIALQETGPTFTGLIKGPGEDLIKHVNWACFPKILSFLPGVIQWQ